MCDALMRKPLTSFERGREFHPESAPLIPESGRLPPRDSSSRDRGMTKTQGTKLLNSCAFCEKFGQPGFFQLTFWVRGTYKPAIETAGALDGTEGAGLV
uniref:Tryptophanyl-tRNA ligase II n=1 Tax=Aureimonas frigidaquae TaxID=424757 RepID=A0A0P0Z0H1_9HYPH|nr:tryptophanyl-tRNA ligase II [Aureimonas frigidaquae]